jgi:thioredoxin reductase (NADPH)
VEVRLATSVVGGGGDGRLDHLVLRGAGGEEETVAANGLFLLIGARPHTDWLPPEIAKDSRGYVLTGRDVPEGSGWPLTREPLLLETSMPGVFSAGEVRANSVKRVASAVGEGSIAIQQVHQYFVSERLGAAARATPAGTPR